MTITISHAQPFYWVQILKYMEQTLDAAILLQVIEKWLLPVEFSCSTLTKRRIKLGHDFESIGNGYPGVNRVHHIMLLLWLQLWLLWDQHGSETAMLIQ